MSSARKHRKDFNAFNFINSIVLATFSFIHKLQPIPSEKLRRLIKLDLTYYTVNGMEPCMPKNYSSESYWRKGIVYLSSKFQIKYSCSPIDSVGIKTNARCREKQGKLNRQIKNNSNVEKKIDRNYIHT